jgi:CRISPR-associated protein Cas5h
MKLLKFKLFGDFAHFNQPISNRFRNTYSIIPKPQLLGLVGSIAGLGGNKNKESEPEFYRILKDVKVFIKCNNYHDKKFVVTYNSMNSYLNNRIDAGSPNVIINEQVLLEPNYEIGLLLNENNNIHKKIINNIQNNQTIFPIYLGKNEFFANIQYISLEDYEINSMEEVKCSSIFPFDEFKDGRVNNMKLEMIPIDFNDNFKYIYRLMAIPQKECVLSFKNPSNFIVTRNNDFYYIF